MVLKFYLQKTAQEGRHCNEGVKGADLGLNRERNQDTGVFFSSENEGKPRMDS